MARKYDLPAPLASLCKTEEYEKWLQSKAVTHCNRDRARGNKATTVEAYKLAIHQAVGRDGATDAYTGQPLRWDLISKYDNVESAARGRAYKAAFGDLPTADHVGDGLGAPDFRICAWRTNDAKNDLPYEEFLALCRAVIAHHGGH